MITYLIWSRTLCRWVHVTTTRAVWRSLPHLTVVGACLVLHGTALPSRPAHAAPLAIAQAAVEDADAFGSDIWYGRGGDVLISAPLEWKMPRLGEPVRVPEPSSVVVLVAAFVGLGLMRRWRDA